MERFTKPPYKFCDVTGVILARNYNPCPAYSGDWLQIARISDYGELTGTPSAEEKATGHLLASAPVLRQGLRDILSEARQQEPNVSKIANMAYKALTEVE